MTTIQFDCCIFRDLFPEFANPAKFSDAMLKSYFELAGTFISRQAFQCRVGGLSPAQQVTALNYMTAHIAALFVSANTGQNTGVVTSATIDKVTVGLMAPPADDQWSYWLNQSPYGQMLLALLDVASAGGFYAGGFPVVGAYRR